MTPARTPPSTSNRRTRRIAKEFASALKGKERTETRREEFEALWAPHYRDYGQRVHDADRARALREADQRAFVDGQRAFLVDGRVVVVSITRGEC